VELEEEAKKKKILNLNPKEFGCKSKRVEVYQQQRKEKKKLKKKKLRLKRQKEAEALGEEAPPKKVPRTLDNTREADETTVQPEDEEVKGDEAIDEFSSYFKGEKIPKICVTTSYKATRLSYNFVKDLLPVIPNSYFYPRRSYTIDQIAVEAKVKDWTDVIIVHECKKQIDSLTIVHLPEGPTAHFKLTNYLPVSAIPNGGDTSLHKPEVILNNFTTRLGHRVGRMFGALFHQEPNFKGKRVITFHNQRDFVFFRHHRYTFESRKKARLQECGPRFTLKLKWLQHGIFDSFHGEYEWKHKRELDTSRRRFHL